MVAEPLGNLTGKRIIVTGATNGVGLGTARLLARAGAHVILAVRNTELGAQRAAEIGGSTSIAKLDLADLSSVRAFPDQFDGDVDILINNAGGLSQHRTDTVDGFEMTIGTNFLGPFALTNLLLGRVRSQIINVGSDAHKSATLRLDDMHLRSHRWAAYPAYGRSKTRGDAVGPRTRPPAAGLVIAGHQPAHAPRMGVIQSFACIGQAADGGFSSGSYRVGEQVWQRHRRRRRADAVLHQRAAHFTGQLCGRRRPAWTERAARC